jgi:murein L,D-transpeptidase YafK
MKQQMLIWIGLSVLLVSIETPLALADNSSAKVKGDETPTKASSAATPSISNFPSSVLQIPMPTHFYSPYAFVVDKKARMLSVWQQTEEGLKRVAQFPADLGKKEGEKQNRGDSRTPEGIYFLQEKMEGASLDFNLYGKRAFTTDYPNFFDRLGGKTGNGIWLHAVPDHVPLTRGSKGCVVVRNDVILNLSQYVRLGRTPLIIGEKDDLLSESDLKKATSEINQWLESWRSAWEKKDLDSYIAKYGEEFKWLKMNRGQYREFKAGLNAKYQTIAVHISKPLIFAYKGRAVVRFLQQYTSDQHTDFGEKTLYLRRLKDNYQIIGETWAAESSQLAKEEIESSTSALSGNCGPESQGCHFSSAATP